MFISCFNIQIPLCVRLPLFVASEVESERPTEELGGAIFQLATDAVFPSHLFLTKFIGLFNDYLFSRRACCRREATWKQLPMQPASEMMRDPLHFPRLVELRLLVSLSLSLHAAVPRN